MHPPFTMVANLVDTTQQSSLDLRTKLRSLIKLTRTVSGINNDGHPTLRKSSRRNKFDSRPKPLRTSNEQVLYATAALLVREEELFALAFSGGSIIAMEVHMDGTTTEEPSLASGDGGNSASGILRIVAVVNPRTEHEYRFPCDSHRMALDSGKSHYRLYGDEKRAWEWFLKIPPNDPLPNHIQTVVHYLKEHKTMQEAARLAHEEYFSKYLVARCWPKMKRRIDSWSSRGYIYELSKIPETGLKGRVSISAGKISTSFTDRHNDDLVELVDEMVQDGEMERVIMRPSGHSEWDFTLITSSGSCTYDVTTCFIFHQLLISTLRAYGIALRALAKAQRTAEAKNVVGEKVKRMKHLVEKSNNVWICGILLSKIASSRMLRQHLMACRGFLHIPTYGFRDDYKTFSTQEDGDGSNWNNVNDLDESAVEDLDLRGDEELDEVFLNWVRLQASYWLNLSTLSRRFGSSNPTYPVPEIFLLAMKHPMDLFGPFIVEEQKDTLKTIIGSDPSHPIDIEEVLAKVKNGGGENLYPPNIHCEAALAVLILLAHHLSAAEAMELGPVIELLQTMDVTLIVVSKLCCPGCWEYLDIVRGALNLFYVSGRHPTLFPFELPAYTSPQVLREMITRFEGFLHAEILTMMMSKNFDCTPSRQCFSNLSTGSQKVEKQTRSEWKAFLKGNAGTYSEPELEDDDGEELEEDEELPENVELDDSLSKDEPSY